MKSANKVKQWLALLLCVLMAAGIMTQAAGAAEATGKCTNPATEGIEYYSMITVIGSEVNDWRQNLNVSVVKQSDGNTAGTVLGMDIEVTNDNTRYTCTFSSVAIDGSFNYSCNSVPVNAIINGVYFLYRPESVSADTPIRFNVKQAIADSSGNYKSLHGTDAVVKFPPFPCARNLVRRDFAAASGKSLVLYTNTGCGETGVTCTTGADQLQCNTVEQVCAEPLVCKDTKKSGACTTTCLNLSTETDPDSITKTCTDSATTCKDPEVDGKCPSKCVTKSDPVDTTETICYAPSYCDLTGTSGPCKTKCVIITETAGTGSPCAAGTTCEKPDSDGNCPTTSKCIGGTTNFYPILKCVDFTCTTGDKVVMTEPLIDEQTLDFYEKGAHKEKYAIVNIMDGDKIEKGRVKISVSPEVGFDYKLTLTFGLDYDEATKKYGSTANVIYTWDPKGTQKITIDASEVDGKDIGELPLTLISGSISEVNKLGRLENGWGGVPEFPNNVDFDIRFWYENKTGTLGYENSVYHFQRNLSIQFANTCSNTATTSGLYDPCQSNRQMFSTKLSSPVIFQAGTGLNYDTDDKTVNVFEQTTDSDVYNFYFLTRKCVNTACDYVTSTNAYPHAITMSDGGGNSRTYTNRAIYGDISTRAWYQMRPYGLCTDETDPSNCTKPFAITGVTMVVDEPGTYVIYAFAKYSARGKTLPAASDYVKAFYVTINSTDELLTCSSLANNGYFKAWWNDCLDPDKTQLLTFEHIPNTEEAWIRNRSAHAVDFPYVAEYSYMPQKLEIASLNCKFEALESGGRPGDGYCNHYNVHVPPYTKVTITGGTMYMSGYPQYDEYRAAYMREDTYNISHLFFSIGVDQCKNKKIPDTGLSLRSPMSPLKVNEKVSAAVDAATGYVFTGNSLRIPAIGLGMEYPIPIVHVYYESEANNMSWDLSTLGNYVGELEGGTYLPYDGNTVLTGHYYSQGVFKNLENLNLEDEIIIYGNDNIKYTYHVVQKFIAQPNDVYEMFQQIGDRSLTLVTCENYNLVTNEYERRYIVRASIVATEPYEEIW